MVKAQIDKSWLLALIIAFLTMQWSTQHIHLSAHHDHNGDHHQHSVEFHTHHSDHQQPSHHADTIDVAGVDQLHHVVELDVDCTACAKKFEPQFDTLPPLVIRKFQLPQFVDNRFNEVVSARPGYLNYSTVRPRAPPFCA